MLQKNRVGFKEYNITNSKSELHSVLSASHHFLFSFPSTPVSLSFKISRFTFSLLEKERREKRQEVENERKSRATV